MVYMAHNTRVGRTTSVSDNMVTLTASIISLLMSLRWPLGPMGSHNSSGNGGGKALPLASTPLRNIRRTISTSGIQLPSPGYCDWSGTGWKLDSSSRQNEEHFVALAGSRQARQLQLLFWSADTVVAGGGSGCHPSNGFMPSLFGCEMPFGFVCCAIGGC